MKQAIYTEEEMLEMGHAIHPDAKTYKTDGMKDEHSRYYVEIRPNKLISAKTGEVIKDGFSAELYTFSEFGNLVWCTSIGTYKTEKSAIRYANSFLKRYRNGAQITELNHIGGAFDLFKIHRGQYVEM